MYISLFQKSTTLQFLKNQLMLIFVTLNSASMNSFVQNEQFGLNRVSQVYPLITSLEF